MSFIQKGASAFGKLIIVIALAATFAVGLVGVVYMSLQGQEIKVPDLVGKDFTSGENELASLGLRIKKRADRLSSEKPNTILEQLPKAGETVKTGQMILVVRSKFDPNAEADKPATLKQNDDEDDSEKIEELISDKPKVSKKNTNSNKKKTSTTRDVIANTSTDDSSDGNSNKSSDSNYNSSKGNKNSSTTSGNKSTSTDTKKEVDTKKESDTKKNTDTKKPAEINKPKPAKSPGGGETRPRKTPLP
ncbi:MAG: PASTA domain-containing protein [Acidobacteriota bacterium]